LIELAIALAVGSITFTALASLMLFRQASVLNLIERRRALFLASADVENVRALAEKPFISIPKNSLTDHEFTLNRSVKNINPCIQSVTSNVSWNTGAVAKNLALNISLPNISYAKGIDGDCGGNLPSNNVLLPEDSVSSLDVLNNLAVAGTQNADSSELIFYSVSGNSLSFASKIDMPSNVNAIDLTQKYAYMASDGPENQFSVVNASNQDLVESVSLPGVAGSFPNAESIFYFNQKIYIGTHRTAGHEFHIFDVSGEKSFWLGSLELNHNVNAISVREPYAFLATSGNTKNLIVLDISDPSAIKQIASLAFAGAEDSLSLFLSGDTLYLGRKKSAHAGEPDFIIIDVENPFQPAIQGSLTLKADVTGIKVFGDYAFLTTSNPTSAITVLNISDPNKPAITSSVKLEKGATGIDAENGTIFIST